MHLGRDWLSTGSVAGTTFMNEFLPYAMQAPPLKRRTRQKFTEFDYSMSSHLRDQLNAKDADMEKGIAFI